jgi:hypothetical protein
MAEPERYLEIHQYQAGSPTDYENALGDALEATFAAGLENLPDIVRRLNEVGIGTADGREWTEKLFELEIKRLADL